MSDILKAIYEDREEYLELCKHFNEEIKFKKDTFGNDVPDTYGSHAQELRNKKAKELKRKAN